MQTRAFHTESSGISEQILGFAHFLRSRGLNVGIQESLEALEASNHELLHNQRRFQYALKSLFCCREEEAEIFDQLFAEFWRVDGAFEWDRKLKHTERITRSVPSSLVLMGRKQNGAETLEEEDSKPVTGANATERLQKTDFSKLTLVETEWLEEIAEKLWQQMSRRLKRKQKASRKGRVDLRKTIRQSISQGGEPFGIAYKQKKPQKQRLVVLLDVSGSMDKYSFFLLRFVHVLQNHFEQIEAFTFSTSLSRVSGLLRTKNIDEALYELSEQIDHWSSGTRIGACFREFNEQYAKRVLTRNSLTIILSDGLETGDPEELSRELNKIQRRTKRLIWLNPLKGMQGYEPIQRGMSAAMPMVDVFKSAHNLESLLELEQYLSHV